MYVSGLCFVLVLYIIILYYTLLLLYYILYYTLLFLLFFPSLLLFSSDLISSSLSHLPSSLPLQSFLSPPLPNPDLISFYTCRHLDILIYIRYLYSKPKLQTNMVISLFIFQTHIYLLPLNLNTVNLYSYLFISNS